MTVEKTTKYATSVDSLPEAFAFVMSKIDDLGESPSIYINPIWVYGGDEEGGKRKFEVAVDGMVEVAE